MDALGEVAEGSTAYVGVSLLDKAGSAAVPSTLRYRVDDGASGAEVLAWTDLTPAATAEIRLPPSVNTLLDQSRGSEERVVTIEAGYGVDDALKAECAYTVRNLRFVG